MDERGVQVGSEFRGDGSTSKLELKLKCSNSAAFSLALYWRFGASGVLGVQ